MLNSVLNMPQVPNMLKFWIWQSSHTQRSVYAKIYLARVLDISWVLNMPGFWIWQGVLKFQELHRVLNMSQYGWICLDRTWICLSVSEFIIKFRGLKMSRFWICLIQYIARVYSTVNEYLLRDGRMQNLDINPR